MQNHRTVPRRAVARGAAWSLPAVAAASAVPAVAASGCTPVLDFSGGITYNWGTVGVSTTNQQFTAGGQTYVRNLPAGVKVTAITYEFWQENRQGQSSPGPGSYYPGNTASDRKSQTLTAMPWTPTAGSGFGTTVSNDQNNVVHTYTDGTSVRSWNLKFTWSSARDTKGTYTSTSLGCQDFTTGPSGRFPINFSNVTALSSGSSSAKSIASDIKITATLSDGTQLSIVTNTTHTSTS